MTLTSGRGSGSSLDPKRGLRAKVPAMKVPAFEKAGPDGSAPTWGAGLFFSIVFEWFLFSAGMVSIQ